MSRTIAVPFLWMLKPSQSKARSPVLLARLGLLPEPPPQARFTLQVLVSLLLARGYEVNITGSQAQALLADPGTDEAQEADIDLSILPSPSRSITSDFGPINQQRTLAAAAVISEILQSGLSRAPSEAAPQCQMDAQALLEGFVVTQLFEGMPAAGDYRGLLRVGPDLDINVPLSEARSYFGQNAVRVRLASVIGPDGKAQLNLKGSTVHAYEGSLNTARDLINCRHLTTSNLKYLNVGMLVKLWLHQGRGGSVNTQLKASLFDLFKYGALAPAAQRTPAQICAYNLLKKIQEPKYSNHALSILFSSLLDIGTQPCVPLFKAQLAEPLMAALREVAATQPELVKTLLTGFCQTPETLAENARQMVGFLQRTKILAQGFSFMKRSLESAWAAEDIYTLSFCKTPLFVWVQPLNSKPLAQVQTRKDLPSFLKTLSCPDGHDQSDAAPREPHDPSSGLLPVLASAPTLRPVVCDAVEDSVPVLPVRKTVRRRGQRRRQEDQVAKKPLSGMGSVNGKKPPRITSVQNQSDRQTATNQTVQLQVVNSQARNMRQIIARRALKQRAQPRSQKSRAIKTGLAFSLLGAIGAWVHYRRHQGLAGKGLQKKNDDDFLPTEVCKLKERHGICHDEGVAGPAPLGLERLGLLFELPVHQDIRLALLPLFLDEVACVALDIPEAQTLNLRAAVRAVLEEKATAASWLVDLNVHRMGTPETGLTLAYWHKAVSEKAISFVEQKAVSITVEEVAFLQRHSQNLLLDLMSLIGVREKKPALSSAAALGDFEVGRFVEVICTPKSEQALLPFKDKSHVNFFRSQLWMANYSLIEGHEFFRKKINALLEASPLKHLKLTYPELHQVLSGAQADAVDFGSLAAYEQAVSFLEKTLQLHQGNFSAMDTAALISLIPVATALRPAVVFQGNAQEHLTVQRVVAHLNTLSGLPPLQCQAVGFERLLIFDANRIDHAAWRLTVEIPKNQFSRLLHVAADLEQRQVSSEGRRQEAALVQLSQALAEAIRIENHGQDPLQKQQLARALRFNLPLAALQGHVSGLYQLPDWQIQGDDQNMAERAMNQTMDSCLALHSLLFELPINEAVKRQVLPVVLGSTPGALLADISPQALDTLSSALGFYEQFYPAPGYPKLAKIEDLTLFYRPDQLQGLYKRLESRDLEKIGMSKALNKKMSAEVLLKKLIHAPNPLQWLVDQLPVSTGKRLLMQVENLGYRAKHTERWPLLETRSGDAQTLKPMIAQYAQARYHMQETLAHSSLVAALAGRVDKARVTAPDQHDRLGDVLDQRVRHPFWRELTHSAMTLPEVLGFDTKQSPSLEKLLDVVDRGIALSGLNCDSVGQSWLSKIGHLVLGLYPATVLLLPRSQVTAFRHFLERVNAQTGSDLVVSLHSVNEATQAGLVCTAEHSKKEAFILALDLLKSAERDQADRFVGLRSALADDDMTNILLNWSYTVFWASQQQSADYLPGMLSGSKFDVSLFSALQNIYRTPENAKAHLVTEASAIYARFNLTALQALVMHEKTPLNNRGPLDPALQAVKAVLIEAAQARGIGKTLLMEQLEVILLQAGQFKGMFAAGIEPASMFEQYLLPITHQAQSDRMPVLRLAQHIKNGSGCL